MPSKDSANLETCLCAKGTAANAFLNAMSLMVWGYSSTFGTETCTCGNVPSMLRVTYMFQSDICSDSDYVFFREGLPYFSKVMLTPNLTLDKTGIKFLSQQSSN